MNSFNWDERAWLKKGSGTVVRSTLWAVPATVPDPFLNQADEAGVTCLGSTIPKLPSHSWSGYGSFRGMLKPGTDLSSFIGPKSMVGAAPGESRRLMLRTLPRT